MGLDITVEQHRGSAVKEFSDYNYAVVAPEVTGGCRGNFGRACYCSPERAGVVVGVAIRGNCNALEVLYIFPAVICERDCARAVFVRYDCNVLGGFHIIRHTEDERSNYGCENHGDRDHQ